MADKPLLKGQGSLRARGRILKNSNSNPIVPTATIPEPKLNSNRLPVQVSIIVPSTKFDKSVSPEEFDRRVENERKWFTKNFGGDTAIKSSGGYSFEKDGKRILIVEDGIKIESSMSVEDYQKVKARLATHIKKRQKEWSQDTIGYQVEGNFYTYPKRDYITHEKKFKNIIIE